MQEIGAQLHPLLKIGDPHMRPTDQGTEVGGGQGSPTSTSESSLPAQARTVWSYDPQTQACCHSCIHGRSLLTEHLDAKRCAMSSISHHSALVKDLERERGLGGGNRRPLPH